MNVSVSASWPPHATVTPSEVLSSLGWPPLATPLVCGQWPTTSRRAPPPSFASVAWRSSHTPPARMISDPSSRGSKDPTHAPNAAGDASGEAAPHMRVHMGPFRSSTAKTAPAGPARSSISSDRSSFRRNSIATVLSASSVGTWSPGKLSLGHKVDTSPACTKTWAPIWWATCMRSSASLRMSPSFSPQRLCMASSGHGLFSAEE
mmetsp:Transcript_87453/g.267574  ORF Transcript_87453/g.267574 Transcript_87453/m.267574 type:complete len:205 (+) Transcript_87453:648-1262(+)